MTPPPPGHERRSSIPSHARHISPRATMPGLARTSSPSRFSPPAAEREPTPPPFRGLMQVPPAAAFMQPIYVRRVDPSPVRPRPPMKEEPPGDTDLRKQLGAAFPSLIQPD